jgi:TPR repeat protein
MADEIERSGEMPDKDNAMAKKRTGAALKKHPQKAAKHAAKKRPKKSSRRAAVDGAGPTVVYAADIGLMTAFHHMQRASVVISLMEKGTGEDLRNLLERGVKLYRKAVDNDRAEKHLVLRAIGILRAAEHLSMAGLYEARKKHKQKVTSPTPEWLTKVVAEADRRLQQIEQKKRGKGPDLFPVTVELLRQATDVDHDAQLAFELAMAADALCFALENGL